jgi:hypothetical protein
MKIRRLLIAPTLYLAGLLMMLTVAASPQGPRIGENCDLAVLGVTETKGFVAFDRELRSALSRHDTAVMAQLVRYPLRINTYRGSYHLEDAASLQSRFEEVFPLAIRQAVLDQRRETINCNYRGIMYGNGDVWVNWMDQRYAIEAINLPEFRGLLKAPTTGRVDFACQTDKHRIIVDVGSGGAPRYRAWDKPHLHTEVPDTEITNGKREAEGFGPCVHPMWTFTSGTTKFVVEALGCSPDSNQPPKGAVGRLDVSTADKGEASSWCF